MSLFPSLLATVSLLSQQAPWTRLLSYTTVSYSSHFLLYLLSIGEGGGRGAGSACDSVHRSASVAGQNDKHVEKQSVLSLHDASSGDQTEVPQVWLRATVTGEPSRWPLRPSSRAAEMTFL